MIRKLMKEEYKNAINLSYQVCIECGINDFTEEGGKSSVSCPLKRFYGRRD